VSRPWPAFRFENDRDDFVAAHALARGCAASMLHAPLLELSWQQHCPECGGPHGRPTIAEAPGLGVTLAHARGHVAAAVAPGVIGVDIEPMQRGRRSREVA